MPGLDNRRIVIAAVRRGSVTFTGLRHGHIIRDMVKCGYLRNMLKPIKYDEQGFLDSEGQYLSREQARRVAIAAHQVKPDHGTLYSEDLW